MRETWDVGRGARDEGRNLVGLSAASREARRAKGVRTGNAGRAFVLDRGNRKTPLLTKRPTGKSAEMIQVRDLTTENLSIYSINMITKVFKSGNSLAVRIPRELGPKEGEVTIERVGERWIVEPIKPARWPDGFFRRIRIDDPAFIRPPQGEHRSVEL